jgi:hypothetical protein
MLVITAIAILEGCGKTRRAREKLSSGAEARHIFEDLAARVNSCPSQNLLELEFFRSLPGDGTRARRLNVA